MAEKAPRACAQGETAAPAQFAPVPPPAAACEQALPASGGRRYRFAVCSRGGELVDQHFGHAASFHIYEWVDGAPVPLEQRDARPDGAVQAPTKEGGRIVEMARAIGDCDAVICLRIGNPPTRVLHERGISVFTTYDLVERSVCRAAQKLRQAASLPMEAALESD